MSAAFSRTLASSSRLSHTPHRTLKLSRCHTAGLLASQKPFWTKHAGLSTPRSFTSAIPCRVTHYEALNLGKNASKHQIKSSFYKLSKELHPDRNPTATQESKDKYLAASAAYNVLVDDRRRRAYDRTLESSAHRSHTTHTSHHHTPDLTRRARATHAWDHTRRRGSQTQTPPHYTPRAGGGAHYHYHRAPGAQNAASFTGRTMSGGRNMTDKGFTKYERDLAEEERVRKDSSLWRYLQVAGLIAGITALAGGIAR
ncbi:hypothetical protein FRB94_009764 [Tulasnella sp. JGI-2019a]|nr:hypothetical protein FRB93_006333 [Tulasnella sp. JGI-2019a]KAG8994636.1 hypothetical protein FRB94_009764 [Tulasnella sp. JGI-2019a]